MEFRLLGPLEVTDGAAPIALSGGKQRALLARLLLDANRTVAVDRLVDALWGEDVPASAVKMVQILVSQLRKALPAGARLVTRAPGYALEIEPEALDVQRFGRLRDAGREALGAGDATTASRRLREALALWRGPALGELSEPFAEAERGRLEDLRLACLEDRVDADLALGRHTDLVGELDALTAQEPLRERFRAQLMLALYRSGRQAAALEAYQALRRTTVEQLGIEPSPALAALHQRILTQDPGLDEPPAPSAPAHGAVSDRPGGEPFVGRRAELDRLAAVLADAVAGSPRIVALAGEPGIGKTRTAQELAALAGSRGATVLWSRCHPYDGAPPYWPWAQLIRGVAAVDAAAPARGAADLARLVPEVAAAAGDAAPPPANPQHARFRLFDAVTAAVVTASRRRPLVLVIDDLHDADDDSLVLLELLARELASTRAALLVAVTYRDADVVDRPHLARTLAALAREPHVERLVLRGLTPADTRRYVALAGLADHDAVAARLQSRTEGHPLYLREAVRLMLAEPGAASRVPDGVRDVIGQRLARLSPASVDVLRLAAILGREFSLPQLVAIGGSDEVVTGVEEALAARIVEERPDGGGALQFTHALFQEVLVDGLPVTRRARLHARVGGALEQMRGTGAGVHAADLARHYGEARPVLGPEPYARACAAAGERALDGYAHEDALGFFERALAAWPRRDDPLAARLLFGLGRAQLATRELHELDEALANLRRAFDIHVSLGNVEAAVAVAAHPLPPNLMYEPAGVHELVVRALELVDPDSAQAARLRSVSGWLEGINHADHASAMAHFDRALASARAAGDRPLELQVLINAQYVHLFHLRWADCLETGRRAATLARATDDARGRVAARGWAARAHIATGDLRAARREAAATQTDAEALGERYWIATSCLHNALVAAIAGEWEAARAFTDRGLAARPHDPRNLGVRALVEHQAVDVARGAAFLDRMRMVIEASPPPGPGADYPLAAAFLPLCDRIAGTAAHADGARAIAGAVLALPHPTPYLSTCAHVGLALIAVAESDVDGAAAALTALERAEGEMLVLPPLSRDRLLGLLRVTIGDVDGAIASLARALALCDAAGFRAERAWVAHDYAAALDLRDDRDARSRARVLRDQSAAAARELGLAALHERLRVAGGAAAPRD